MNIYCATPTVATPNKGVQAMFRVVRTGCGRDYMKWSESTKRCGMIVEDGAMYNKNQGFLINTLI